LFLGITDSLLPLGIQNTGAFFAAPPWMAILSLPIYSVVTLLFDGQGRVAALLYTTAIRGG
jgi:hypothetical protein